MIRVPEKCSFVGMNIKDNNDRHDNDNQNNNYRNKDDNQNTNDKSTRLKQFGRHEYQR